MLPHLLVLLVVPAMWAAPAAEERAPPTFRAGRLEAEAIKESSGLVASRRHEGVFWTVNDSGNAPVLYAVARSGELIRAFPVDAENVDWEDLAIDDDGHLYVADVGNNDGRRTEVRVLQLEEPDPQAPAPNRAGTRPAAPLRVAAAWRLTYPGGRAFDCEGLAVLDGAGWLISKRRDGAAAELYRFALTPAGEGGPAVLERVGALPVRAPVTAADVSPDGKRLVVLTVLGPWLFEVGGDVAAATRGAPAGHSWYVHPTMEAACVVPGGVLVTAESREVFFFADRFFQPVAPAKAE